MRRLASLVASLAVVLAAFGGCQSGGYQHSASTASAPTSTPSYAAPTYAAPAPRPMSATPSAAYAAPAAAPAYTPMAGGPIPYDARDITIEQARAAAGGKPVALYILSSTCGYCSRLEASTLTDGNVQTEMHRFYNVRIDSRSAAGSAIARQYARSGYPQTTVLDASGNVRGGIIGYEDAARYAGDLHRIQ